MISSRVKARDYCGIDVRCEMITSFVEIDDGEKKSYTTYGARLIDHEGKLIKEYPDISTDIELVRDFVEICESCGACALHIQDVIDDFIG